MLSLTKKTDYALIAMSYLIERADRTVSAREIATAFQMPAALVMNILKTLHHSGLLSSTRGTKGGYRVTSDLSKVSIHDLIQMLEGPVKLTECSPTECESTEPRSCKVRGCPISVPIQTVHARLVGYLKEVKLSDILGNGHRQETPVELTTSATGSAAPAEVVAASTAPNEQVG
ncbi:MAG TPA: Rrf2 family transcriptional regulator [Tepidisphaeraceae bacterium]|nr:Rrf2 family transcriptional regulator [Tepidisphaeraceae bacterium]